MKRMAWVHHVSQLMESENFYIAFLDEKWFYTQSRRKKMKVLPAHQAEEEKDLRLMVEQEVSRWHATKVMYLGAV